ncbi:MAG: hypothetical protein PHF86_09790 [Candidatus Nanoarchaeia archaeon]|jgi:hypothetical protein|nr:hypothetical protein [Candidatus Nanoarchaeia archaeon]
MQKIARFDESAFLDSLVTASEEILIQKSRKPGQFVVTIPTTDGKTQDLSGTIEGIIDTAGDLAAEGVIANSLIQKLTELLNKQ